jgi:hypothetical protein
MSENLMASVAPLLAAPVTRDRIRSAAEIDGDVQTSTFGVTSTISSLPITFADDDAE